MSIAARGVHWARIGESTFAAGIWFLYGVNAVAGRRVLRLLLWPVVLFYACTQPRARRASLDYLRRIEAAHGVLGEPPRARHWLRHLMAFAETLVDKLLATSGRYRFAHVRIEGQQQVERLLAEGRGAVLVTAHVGCLELCQALASRMPALRLTVLVHTRHAERFNAILRRLNPESRVELLQVTDVNAATAVELEKIVRAGGFVAIAGDRVPVDGGRIARVPFLGAPAEFPVGAYVLASLLACPLLMLGCVREGGGHVVRFEALAESVELPRTGRTQALEQYAASFAQRLEALLVRSPYEWFNFYPFWSRT
ncbi:acyltransferase [Ramlibacter henchirensis]|uniref:Acyltransferase n=1 Tax=Ramlibacter henchirensis TaxID=204072 RepID=A0A4Z0BM41_9BURK|nr:acyltransferase [Ramlibacter henchirensis]TFZ00396.1 acyltransferase [Ramlibacter henchirensis]